MVSQDMITETEYAKQEVLSILNRQVDTSDGTKMQARDLERVLRRMLDLTRICMQTGEHEYGLEIIDFAKPYCEKLIEHATGMTLREVSDYVTKSYDFEDSRYDLYWDFVLEESYDRFEPFMFYMEKNRPFEKKFYEPRQYTKSGKPALKRVAQTLQDAGYGKYKTTTISMPSRVGKSTIFIFFLCWNALRHPNSHSAYGGYSGVLAKGFYKEVMNLITSPEYTYHEIYSRFNPTLEFIRDKSAEDFTVTLGDADRFATVTCRGIDGSWTGIIDVSADGGVLAVDDLIRDREHSMSPQRMENTWQEYLNKMVDRKNVGAIEILIGTLWGVLDPIERLRKMHEGDPEYCFLRIPALDENDESNFDYLVNGFTTEYYKEMRERLDNAEWMAKYQQQPYVREGLLFPTDQMQYFDGLVCEADIKRVYAVADSATGGGDNVSCPICYEMNDGRKFICKWIYDKRTIAYTVPRVVNAIPEHTITEMRVERNGVGALFLDKVKEYAKKQNIAGCKIRGVSAPIRMSKEDKIQGYSDTIKNNYQFLAPRANKPSEMPQGYIWFERDPDYQNAMDCMSMYTSEGKNYSDDAPDSMAQLAIMDETKSNGQIEVIHMPSGFGL